MNLKLLYELLYELKSILTYEKGFISSSLD